MLLYRNFFESMAPIMFQPPVNSIQTTYTPGVTGAYGVVMDLFSNGGGGSGSAGFHQNININEHVDGKSMMKKRGSRRYMSPSVRATKLTPTGVMAATLMIGAFEQQSTVPPISADPFSSIPMVDLLVNQTRNKKGFFG